MEREALKIALEALDLVNIEFVCNGAHHAKKDRHSLDEDCPVTMRYQKAITAIKEALAHPAQKPVGEIRASSYGQYPVVVWVNGYLAKIGDKFYTAPPQPAQEQWNAALDEAAARIGEMKGFGQATQDSFSTYIKGLKK